MARCKTCNAIIPDGAEYCEECLTKLNTAKEAESYLDSLLNTAMVENPHLRETGLRKKAASLKAVSKEEKKEPPVPAEEKSPEEAAAPDMPTELPQADGMPAEGAPEDTFEALLNEALGGQEEDFPVDTEDMFGNLSEDVPADMQKGGESDDFPTDLFENISMPTGGPEVETGDFPTDLFEGISLPEEEPGAVSGDFPTDLFGGISQTEDMPKEEDFPTDLFGGISQTEDMPKEEDFPTDLSFDGGLDLPVDGQETAGGGLSTDLFEDISLPEEKPGTGSEDFPTDLFEDVSLSGDEPGKAFGGLPEEEEPNGELENAFDMFFGDLPAKELEDEDVSEFGFENMPGFSAEDSEEEPASLGLEEANDLTSFGTEEGLDDLPSLGEEAAQDDLPSLGAEDAQDDLPSFGTEDAQDDLPSFGTEDATDDLPSFGDVAADELPSFGTEEESGDDLSIFGGEETEEGLPAFGEEGQEGDLAAFGTENDDFGIDEGINALLDGIGQAPEEAAQKTGEEEISQEDADIAELLAGFGDFAESSGGNDGEGLKNSSSQEEAEEEGKGAKKKKKKKEKGQGLWHKLFDNVKIDPSKIKPEPTPEEIAAKKKAKEEAKAKAKEEKEAEAAEKKEEEKRLKQEKQQKAREEKEKKKAKKLEEAKLLLEEMEATRINRAGASIVFIFFAMIAVVVIVGTSIFSYSVSIKNAEYQFSRKEYTAAYNEIFGIDVKDEDIILYDRIMTVMYVQKQLNSYYNYFEMKDYPHALDSLLKGLMRYEKYIELAVELEIETDLDSVRNSILSETQASFSISEQEAMEIIQSKTPLEYSTRVYKAVEKVNE